MRAPAFLPLLDRLGRVLDARLCATPALETAYRELQAEQGRLAQGIHMPPPHLVVQRLTTHRNAVLLELLQVAERYLDTQQRATDLLLAHKAAQRYRYEQHKAWRRLPIDAPAEEEAAAEARDQRAVVALERAGIDSSVAAKDLQAQRDPLDTWEQRLAQAQLGLQRARLATQPKPRPPLSVALGIHPPAVRVPPDAPVMRLRRS